MRYISKKLMRWYRRALKLYPSTYRETYAEEMQTVFEMRLAEFSSATAWNLLKFSLRELRDLPIGVAAAYLHERNRLKMKSNMERWFVHEPGSIREGILAVLPFFLTAFVTGLLSIIPAVNNLPIRVGQIILLFLTLVQIIFGVIGLAVRLPRWSLPYAGVLVSMAPLSILAILYHQGIFRLPQTNIMFFSTILFYAAYLVVLFLLVSFIVWAAGKIRFIQSFAERVKNDKTLLSFMMYGGTLSFLATNYEDTIGAGLYLMVSALAMMLGAWFYLRQKSIRGKMTALSLGNSAAILTALLTTTKLLNYYPSTVFSLGSIEITIFDIYVLLSWLVSQAMIFGPLLLRGTFGRENPETQNAIA